MNLSVLRASRSRLSLIPLIALAAIAIASFVVGSDAAAATGGVSAGGSGGGKAKSATGAKYERLWDRSVRAAEKRWAHEVAICESGKDPNATALNGQYRGAFMFLRSSWRTSPKSPGGDPIDYSYKTQAVVAVMLKRELGTKPWPVCG